MSASPANRLQSDRGAGSSFAHDGPRNGTHPGLRRPSADPGVVPEVLQSPGRPLDNAIAESMRSRFDYDFSSVRVHTDAQAASSADTLDALAYTVGNHVVFGPRQFAPESMEGSRLLAHELVHVMQGGSRTIPARLALGRVDSASEREAARLSLQPPSGVSDGGALSPVPPGLVQRTIKGALLGGALGGAAGATLGAFAGGGLGALIGGALGFVGGALIGEDASTRRRKLTGPEIQDARDIFQDSIDYAKIEITRDSAYSVGAPRTIGNTIHLKSSWGDFVNDTLDLTDRGKETLIHEMTHVWQYQNGGLAYIPLSLIAQIRASWGKGSRNAAYNWRDAIRTKTPWERWNPEQQAQLVEDYNKALKKIHDKKGTGSDYHTVSLAIPYIKKVQRREGAPSFHLGAPDSGFLSTSGPPAMP